MKCAQANDKFKVSNASAKLEYSISLITVDELAMAGGVLSISNNNYYLYNGKQFWTMSPSLLDSNYTHAVVWSIGVSGNLDWNRVSNFFGVRPVINLKSDVKISSGDGTSIAPYVIK